MEIEKMIVFLRRLGFTGSPEKLESMARDMMGAKDAIQNK
jgi:hypothetical protein